jgi:hypothetical protein
VLDAIVETDARLIELLDILSPADVLSGPAARVTIPESIAWRLFTKGISRAGAAARVVIEGDHALGAPVLDAVAIVG